MLADEEEVGEPGIAQLRAARTTAPRWRGTRQARRDVQPSQQREVARDRDVQAECEDRQGDADDTLREHAERAQRPREQHEARGELRASLRASCATTNAHSAPVMNAVSVMSSVTNCDPRKYPQHEPITAAAIQPARGGKQPARRQQDGDDREQPLPAPATGAWSTRPAGDREHRGGGPVLQRRLLEIRHAVEMRRDPVAVSSISRGISA
jgi:hypothetical protein